MRPLLLAALLVAGGADVARADDLPLPPVPITPVAPVATPPGTQPVTFLARPEGAVSHILVDGQRCTTPCLLALRPGQVHLFAATERLGEFERVFDVPKEPATVFIEAKDYRPALGSGVLLTAGAGLTIGGAVMLYGSDSHSRTLAGALLLAGGGASLIGGFFLAWKASKGDQVEIIRGNAWVPRATLSSIGVVPLVGGAGVGAGVTF